MLSWSKRIKEVRSKLSARMTLALISPLVICFGGGGGVPAGLLLLDLLVSL